MEPVDQPQQPLPPQTPVAQVQPAAPVGQIPTGPDLDTLVGGKRFMAGIIDYILIIFGLSLTNQGGYIEFKFTSSGYSVIHSHQLVHLSGLKGLITVLVIIIYFVLFEALKGATIGKLAAGIKVVKEDGSKISYKQSIIRNLCRVVDGFPYVIPYILGAIVMLPSKKRQRIGDKLAKTLVVKKTV